MSSLIVEADPNRSASCAEEIKLSEVISAMSYALDITEGQPEGHAVRSCMIGMRIANEIGLSEARKEALFYALLLKDLGCSSNAAKMCWLFEADDRTVKRDIKLVDWSNLLSTAAFSVGRVLPGASLATRLRKVVGMAGDKENSSRRLIKVRCERGAEITRMLGFPEETAEAILALDEHWNGNGHPLGLKGDQISVEGRICSLAQTMEVFIANFDIRHACQIAKRRKGRWFDPELVRVFLRIAKDQEFVRLLSQCDPRSALNCMDPPDQTCRLDDQMLDNVALAFSQVIDAKSPWTLRHSEGVADIAVGISETMGFSEDHRRELRRAGLLHDIGKLGVSNLILDKPDKLTDEEYGQMKSHTLHTQKILERVACFRRFADYASAHHERVDGRGYHRNLKGDAIALEAKILAVADVCEALMADRPYRTGMDPERIVAIISSERGTAFCPEVVEAFLTYQDKSDLFRAYGARKTKASPQV